jgi:hypothetical protein
MTTPTFPGTLTPSGMTWALISNSQSSQSPLSKAVKTYELPGAAWSVTLSYSNWLDEDLAPLEAFLNSLRGMAGRFLLWNMKRPKPRGVATGTPVVVNSGSTKTALKTSGWTASKTGILLPGDFVGVNGELKQVIDSVDSDSSGDATLTIEPPLRTIPDDDAAITTDKPTATFMLIDDKQASFQYQSVFGAVTIQAIEDVTA